MTPTIYNRSARNTGVMTRIEDREFSPMSDNREKKKESKPWVSPYTIVKAEMPDSGSYGDKSRLVTVTKPARNVNEADYLWDGFHILEGTVLYLVERKDLNEFLAK